MKNRIAHVCVAITCWLLGFPNGAQAQQEGFWDWSRLVVRSTLDKKVVAQPALFSATFPKGAKDHFAIDAAASYDVMWGRASEILKLGPFAEYHRNTELDKEQDVLKLGGAYDLQLGDFRVFGGIKWANDRTKDNPDEQKKLQSNLFLALVPAGCGAELRCVWIPGVTTDLFKPSPSAWQFRYQIDVGLEYDRISLDTLPGTTLMGTPPSYVFRGVGQITAALWPAGKKIRRRIGLTAAFVPRVRLRELQPSEERWTTLFKTALEIWILGDVEDEKKPKFGVTLLYQNGADPYNGLKDQEFWRLALAVKF